MHDNDKGTEGEYFVDEVHVKCGKLKRIIIRNKLIHLSADVKELMTCRVDRSVVK